MLETPILFIIFNRPDLTKQVFEAIKRQKPKNLYIVSDGPRVNNAEDLEKIVACRNLVLNNIDWECNVKTLFREKNLGSGLGIVEALNWFFDNEDYGIILEDDCLANDTFFSFCENLLIRYADKNEIMHISGNSYLLNMFKPRESYFFSKVPISWGWATWKRAWLMMNYKMDDFEERFTKLPPIGKIWYNDWKAVLDDDVTDAWDFQWYFSILTNNGICIHPSVDLVENIGFSKNATHTFLMPWWYQYIEFSNIQTLIHPVNIEINTKADKFISKQLKDIPLNLYERIKLRMRNLDKFFLSEL